MTDQHITSACTCEEPQDRQGVYGRIDEEWTQLEPEVKKLVDDWVATHPGDTERLIPLLHYIQEEIGHLPVPVQQYVARGLHMSPERVIGVVTFYNFFTMTPRGKYQLKVCTGTACFVKRSQRLLETLEETLDVKLGDVTDDRLFSIDEVRCIGACGLAPAMMVNSEVHGNLSPPSLPPLLKGIRKQEENTAGKDAPENARG